jgi:hypothetical protein
MITLGVHESHPLDLRCSASPLRYRSREHGIGFPFFSVNLPGGELNPVAIVSAWIFTSARMTDLSLEAHGASHEFGVIVFLFHVHPPAVIDIR